MTSRDKPERSPIVSSASPLEAPWADIVSALRKPGEQLMRSIVSCSGSIEGNTTERPNPSSAVHYASTEAPLEKPWADIVSCKGNTEGDAVGHPTPSSGSTEVPQHPSALMPRPGSLNERYREAIANIHCQRGTTHATGGYALEVQEKAFEAFLAALGNSCSAIVSEHRPEWARKYPPTCDTYVLASAPGSGKSTLAKAFAVALTRLTATSPFPLGCVFLVHHIATAEAVFRELRGLLPDHSVAVFTTMHDADNPQAQFPMRFSVADLERHPVIVTTHEFFMGLRGERARFYRRGPLKFPRALTFVDERANEIAVYDTDMSALEGVLKFAQQNPRTPPEVLQAMNALVQFAHTKRYGELDIETPLHDNAVWRKAIEGTQALRSEEAGRYARSASTWEPTGDFDAVFGFAMTMAEGRAFIARQNKGHNGVNFVGYERALPQLPGMVLLDATADIDGINKVATWRKSAKTPPERFDHLEIVHAPSVATGNLRRWLKQRANMTAYVGHICDLILRHVAQGQRVLLVCTKAVVVAKNIGGWSEHMVPFLNRTNPGADEMAGDNPNVGTEFAEGVAWALEGRLVAVTWFGGFGIGANVWRDADCVIVCDDYYLPQRVVRATLQGLRGHKATEGLIADTDEHWSDELSSLRDGHILRWMKQMALRGKARNMNEHGVCGHQKLVITGDLVRLLGHRPKVFPGAKVTSEAAEHGGYLHKLAALLLSTDTDEVSTKVVGEKLGVLWGNSNLISQPLFHEVIEGTGWIYHRGRGQKPGCFTRIRPQ